MDGAVVDVGLFSGQANVAVAADSDDAARSVLEQLRALLPAPDRRAPRRSR